MDIKNYEKELIKRDLKPKTKELYLRALQDLQDYKEDRELDQDLLEEYKKKLLKENKVITVNTKISIINNYLKFNNLDLSLKREPKEPDERLSNLLTETDYNRLLRMAETRGRTRIRAILLVLYHTGIKAVEFEYLTVKALNNGFIDIPNDRVVPINDYLKKELKQYIKDKNITQGAIIKNLRDKPLDPSSISKSLKWIAGQARVKKDKVYPQNFRNLFALHWLKNNNNNIIVLADILGYTTLETTKLYINLSPKEKKETMELF